MDFLSFKILNYGPCFVGTVIVVEKEAALGGGDWTLAADLLDDFGQNCFCIIRPCDGAVSREIIDCHRPLVVEEGGKHLLPTTLKSRLADFMSLVVKTQPCFVYAFAGDALEWYKGLISCGDIRHAFGSIRLNTSE